MRHDIFEELWTSDLDSQSDTRFVPKFGLDEGVHRIRATNMSAPPHCCSGPNRNTEELLFWVPAEKRIYPKLSHIFLRLWATVAQLRRQLEFWVPWHSTVQNTVPSGESDLLRDRKMGFRCSLLVPPRPSQDHRNKNLEITKAVKLLRF